LLADFDDIDKNLASADKVFANLKNIHELDNVEYLTTEQKQLLQRFFSSFSNDQESLIRERFIKLWSHIFDIYVHFNKLILQQGITYEGALYRNIVEGKEFEQHDKINGNIKNGTSQNIVTNLTFNSKRYLFVGFNVVQKVEQQLFKTLKKEDKASFYWDLDKFFLARMEEKQEDTSAVIFKIFQMNSIPTIQTYLITSINQKK
jgi:hypothetical protein